MSPPITASCMTTPIRRAPVRSHSRNSAPCRSSSMYRVMLRILGPSTDIPGRHGAGMAVAPRSCRSPPLSGSRTPAPSNRRPDQLTRSTSRAQTRARAARPRCGAGPLEAVLAWVAVPSPRSGGARSQAGVGPVGVGQEQLLVAQLGQERCQHDLGPRVGGGDRPVLACLAPAQPAVAALEPDLVPAGRAGTEVMAEADGGEVVAGQADP